MAPSKRKQRAEKRQQEAEIREAQTVDEDNDSSPLSDHPSMEETIGNGLDENKNVDARTRPDTATNPQGDHRAETAVVEQPDARKAAKLTGDDAGMPLETTGENQPADVDNSTIGTQKVQLGQQDPKGVPNPKKAPTQKAANPTHDGRGHRADTPGPATYRSGRRSPFLRSPTPMDKDRYGPNPPLFKDASKESETDYEPFLELRSRLTRQRNALIEGIITPNDYVMNAFDIMQQAEGYYKEIHATAREARREEKKPAPRASTTTSIEIKPTSHLSDDGSNTEAEMIRAAQEESRRTHREEVARKTTRTGIDNQRGEMSTARLAEGKRTSRPNRAVDNNHNTENENKLPRNDEAVEPWSIPEYPTNPDETDLEAEYRKRLNEYRGLQQFAEIITQMHHRELIILVRIAELEKENDLQHPDYESYQRKLTENENWFSETYNDLLDNISVHLLACRRLIEENHVLNRGNPNQLTSHAGQLMQRMSAFGKRVAILQKARDDRRRSLRNDPERRIHYVAHGREINGMVIDFDPLPPTISGDPRAFDDYFFPGLVQVSDRAGKLPNVEVLDKPQRAHKARTEIPEKSQEKVRTAFSTRAPKFVMRAVPPDDDGSDSSNSSDSNTGGKKNGKDASKPKGSKKSHDSREPSEAPKGIDRFPTPSRETAHPHLPYVLPDPPGIGGIQFQDEKEVWIRLVRELDAEKGITEEDAAYRNAKSRSTALIRSALEANKNKAPGKSILAQNNIKVDANHITKYTGSSNTKDLERFASQLIDYFKMTNLLGPGEEMEEHRVLYASKRMDGKALDFYNDKISGATEEWTLIEVFQALESEFLPQSLYEKARERFDTFRQRNGENVISAYRRLKTYSDAMFYEAGPYEMRYRFFHGVRDEIRGVLAHDDCTPEKGRWRLRDMLKIAINIEEGIEKAKSRHFTSSRNDYQSNGRDNRRSKRDNRESKRHESSKKYEDRSGYKKREEPRDRSEKPKPEVKTADNYDRYKKFSKPTNKKVDKDTCLKCHGKGHWASQCPKVFVGNVLVNPEDEHSSGDEHNPDATPGGLGNEQNAGSSGDESVPDDPAQDGGYETAESHAWKSDCSSDNYPRSSAATVYELNEDEVAKCVAKAAKSESSEAPLHRNRVITANGGKNIFGGVSSECISGYIKIGGMKAHTLIDTGSEVQMISANFAAAAKIPLKRLSRPIGIYLATAGHKSSVTHGCEAEMVTGAQKVQTYWDVGRLDYYDAIIGIQALRSLKCSIDTGSNKVVLADGSLLIKEDDMIHPSKAAGPMKRKNVRFPSKGIKAINDEGMRRTEEIKSGDRPTISANKADRQ
jgi:hypothetical protein